MRRPRGLTWLTLALLGALVIPPAPVLAALPFCGDVQLVWARGAGQPLDDDDNFDLIDGELDSLLGESISYTSYELGQEEPTGFGGFSYPAGGDHPRTILEWTLGEAGEFSNSVTEGRAELDAWLTHRTVECPGEVYVLAGLSEGAKVIGDGLFDLDEAVLDRIAYVAIFGDPNYTTLTDQAGPLSNNCQEELPSWVEGTAQCWAQGILGERVPYIPASLDGRVGSWCSSGDFACSSIPTDLLLFGAAHGGPHGRYFIDGFVDQAMQKAAASLEDFLPAQANDIDASFLRFATGNAGADLVFIFDTTGSMGGSIANAKAQATELADLWLSTATNGRIALVEFRDHGDPFVARIKSPLTNDAEAFQAAVNQLVAGGGGDGPEAQLSGVMTALDGLDWKVGATKIAIVITDNVGKDPEPVTGYTRAQAAQRALEIDPVAIYGVSVAGQVPKDWMVPMAEATAGQVAVLGQGQTLSNLLGDVIDDIALSPVAVLGGPYFAASGNPVFFSADRSFDPDAELVSYEWDFDGNGTTDQTTTGPTVEHTYPGAYSGIAVVRVVSADGGEALGSAEVTVDTAGLADDVAVAPAAAAASLTAPGEVTVTWTPAANDRADGYTIRLDGTHVLRYAEAGSGNSMTFTGLDLGEPLTFSVRAANEYGQSPATVTDPITVSGPGVQITAASAFEAPVPPGGCDPICPDSVSAPSTYVYFDAAGTASDTSATISGIDVRLYGVRADESRELIFDWVPMGTADGAFDETTEEFAIDDERFDLGYTWYDFEVRATAGGQSATATQRVLVDRDTTDPVSVAGPAGPPLSEGVNIPIYARDDRPGQLTVELWARHRPNAATSWTTWSRHASATYPGDPSYSVFYLFGNGDADYEFYSIAIDAVGNRENPPALADTTAKRDAVNDPPAVSGSFAATKYAVGGGFNIRVEGAGTAVDDRSNLSVSWALYGVKASGQRVRIFNFTPATATDGVFDERIEDYTVFDDRAWNSTHVSYSIEIKVSGAGASTTRTFAVPITGQ